MPGTDICMDDYLRLQDDGCPHCSRHYDPYQETPFEYAYRRAMQERLTAQEMERLWISEWARQWAALHASE